MKDDKEKAREILRKREAAAKGLKPKEERDPETLEDQDEREEKVADAGLALGLGLKRSG